MKIISMKIVLGFGLSPLLAGLVLGIIATTEEICMKGFRYESYIIMLTSVPFSIASVFFYGIPLALLGAINSALNTVLSFRAVALSSVAGGSLCYAWSLAILYLSKINKSPSEISHDTFPARPYGDDFLIFITATLISMTASLALLPRHKNSKSDHRYLATHRQSSQKYAPKHSEAPSAVRMAELRGDRQMAII